MTQTALSKAAAAPATLTKLLALLLAFVPGLAAASVPDSLAFKVWFDGRPVGSHDFRLINGSDDNVDVTSTVSFTVKVLFVTAFDYDHVANERWRGACLERFESRTQVNGERMHLTGQATQDGFLLQHHAGESAPATLDLGECIGTYAYWDLARLERATLMNAQTGRLDQARLQRVGVTPLPRLGRSAEAYSLETDTGTIRLWYSDVGEWLALETTTRGKPLVYLNEVLLETKS